jgi:hypothetical protein
MRLDLVVPLQACHHDRLLDQRRHCNADGAVLR